MNAHAYAYRSETPSNSVKSPAETERDIILRVTRELKFAAETRNEDYRKFVAAIYANRRLWSILSADVALTSNALPADLRARIFYLGEFVQDHSRKVLNEGLEVEALVDINLSVLRGLTPAGGDK